MSYRTEQCLYAWRQELTALERRVECARAYGRVPSVETQLRIATLRETVAGMERDLEREDAQEEAQQAYAWRLVSPQPPSLSPELG